MNIAFFGGSFDPPHFGHEMIVKMALNELKIDKLIVMPTFINPFKNSFCAPPNLRLKWIKKLWKNLEKVEISDYEIRQNRPVPTIQSVRHILKNLEQNGEVCENFYLLLGADHLATLHFWDEFENLSKLVKFIIANRDGILIPQNLQNLAVNVNISSSKIRQNLEISAINAIIKDEVIELYGGLKMQNRIEVIRNLLDTKKAENIEIIDMSDKDYIAKFVIIATTLTGRHGMSLVDELKSTLKPLGEEFLNIESSDDWIVIDLGDILIHLMSEVYRDKYNIEDFLSKLKKENN